jgi:CheY-like chemotaxis protein
VVIVPSIPLVTGNNPGIPAFREAETPRGLLYSRTSFFANFLFPELPLTPSNYLLTKKRINYNLFSNGSPVSPMAQKKILIADDNQNIREALSYLLEDEGYKLWLARDGAETLAMVKEVRPDILFLDVMMPEMNGYEVCRIIKNDPGLRKTYVIMLTAKGQVAEQERGRDVNADEYIVKPFSPMEILAKVKKILGT